MRYLAFLFSTFAISAIAQRVDVRPPDRLVEIEALEAATADAVAHAATAHQVTDDGGFQGGEDAVATAGGAVGNSAAATTGGAIGASSYETDGGGAIGDTAIVTAGGGAVGLSADADSGAAVGSAATSVDGGAALGRGASSAGGGAVGFNAIETGGGGAVGTTAMVSTGGAAGYEAVADTGGSVGEGARTSAGFAGGYHAFATADGTHSGDGIDAVQLGTGGNSTPGTLQVYSYPVLDADGYIITNRIPFPSAGSQDLSSLDPSPEISGGYYHYAYTATTDYALTVAASAPRYAYSLKIVSSGSAYSCTLGSTLHLQGSWTATGTNILCIIPQPNGTDWDVYGRGL